MGDPVKKQIAIGVDIGQVQDPTAIALTEVAQVETGKYRFIKPVPAHIDRKGQFVPAKDADPVMRSEYWVRDIRRLPLGTSYPEVGSYLVKLLRNPLFKDMQVRMLIDITGVGRAIYDDIKREIDPQLLFAVTNIPVPPPIASVKPISFVHGEAYNRTKGTLGKAFLVSRLQSLLQGGRVHAPDTPEVMATLEELRVYQIKISDKGTDQYGAFKTGTHDDLATALGLSVLEDPYALQVAHSERVY